MEGCEHLRFVPRRESFFGHPEGVQRCVDAAKIRRVHGGSIGYTTAVKLAYENSTMQPQGASYMPKNVIREEHTSSGMGASNQPDGAFEEQRAVAYRSGIDAARHHFGVKASSLTQPGSPATNALDDTLKKPNDPNIPDAGTGYATSGAQYGADIRK